jgi:acyl-CoA reductase-like NAD-dependent aldehyde dehydrogenase
MSATPAIEAGLSRPNNPKAEGFLKSGPGKLLIGGKWVPAKSGKTFETINPATEEVIGTVAEAGQADVDDAVKAARRAFEEGPWPRMQPFERARLLTRFAELLEANAQELGELDTLDGGRVFRLTSTVDPFGSAEGIRYSAGWATKFYGETNPSGPDIFNFTLREPLGVIGIIIPWNAPLALAANGPAFPLALGNTIVMKVAEQTPLVALRVGQLFQEAGFPDGVVNILTGFGPVAGAALAAHPDVDGISFTGSVSTGKEIVKASAVNLKKLTLELGGKSPNIIFADAAMDAAVPSSIAGIFHNQGQACIAGSRIFVQQKVYDEFAQRFTEAAGQVKTGDPFANDTIVGPLVSETQFKRVTGYINIGEDEGARLLTGGPEKAYAHGYYVKPTVFANVHNRMRIAQEEIFGPVAALIPFKDENDAVLQGNDTVYGLGAGIWTRDISRAITMARKLKAGMVWINGYYRGNLGSPFGGYKQSGMGRQGSVHTVQSYTQIKAVTVTL